MRQLYNNRGTIVTLRERGYICKRFQRVEKLNSLIAAGWAIKEMKSENNSTFFVLEKAD